MPTDPQPARSVKLTARADSFVLEFFQWAFKLPNLDLGETFTLLIDEEGLSVLAPQKLGPLSWGESVNDLAIYVHMPRRDDDFPGLYVYHENDNFTDMTYEYMTVTIGIELTPADAQLPHPARVDELLDIVNDINRLRGMTTIQARAGGLIENGLPLEPYVPPLASRSLEQVSSARPSAHLASRRAFLPVQVTFGVAFSTIAGCILLIVRGGSAIAGVMFIALAVIAMIVASITRFQLELAIARERLAGYTTLNGSDLELEQRHPYTRKVIRAANEPALTKAEFAAALRGVAA